MNFTKLLTSCKEKQQGMSNQSRQSWSLRMPNEP